MSLFGNFWVHHVWGQLFQQLKNHNIIFSRGRVKAGWGGGRMNYGELGGAGIAKRLGKFESRDISSGEKCQNVFQRQHFRIF